jgi:hypothetical protein
MRFPWLILSYILFPLITFAQSGSISGVVTNSETKKPIARASVFLSNSAAGTATNDDGKYYLSGIRPGQYTMVVSVLGYEQYSKTILVGSEPIKLDIPLATKPLMLKEVVISSAADWKKNYEAFKKEFIGTDENAKYCEIKNPHVLNLTYNPTKQILHAESDNFLIVENKALGYRIKYLLNDFNIDHISNLISQHGEQVFEELPGSDSQKKKWRQKRDEAYYGSYMHFLRSLYTDKLREEGFEIYRLKRYRNPLRPDDEVIRQKFGYFKMKGMIDSANYYVTLERMSKWYNETVMKPALLSFEVLNKDETPGLYDLHFINYLYVVYKNKTDDVFNRDIYRPMDMPNYAVSVLTSTTPFAAFDMNGIMISGGIITEGRWSMDRISELLPVDYVPENPVNSLDH